MRALTFSIPLFFIAISSLHSADKLPEHAIARLGSINFRHGDDITALSVSMDGKHVASGSRDRTIRVWEADTGHLLKTFRVDAPYPVGVAFSPDSKTLLTSLDSENLHLIEWATDKAPRAIKVTIPQSVSWSSDMKHFACSTADDDVQIYSTVEGKKLHQIKSASRAVFAKDAKSFAVAHLGGDIKWYDAATGAVQKTFSKFQGNVMDLKVSGDGGYLAAHFTSGFVGVWDLETDKLLHEIKGNDPLQFVPGQSTLTLLQENNVCFLDLKSGEIKTTRIIIDAYAPIVFSPDGNRLFAAGGGHRVRVWNLTTGKELVFGEGHVEEIRGLAYSNDGKSLLSASGDGLRLWDAKTFQERATARRDGRIHGLAVEPKGTRFITGVYQQINIWNPVDFSKQKPYPDQPSLTVENKVDQTAALAYAPDGSRFAFAEPEKKIVFADPRTGAKTPGLAFTSDPIAAAFSPNGRYLAVLTRDGFLHHWQIGSRDGGTAKDLELWKRRVQRNSRGQVAYSPDGLLVVAYSAGRVTPFESATGKQWNGFDRQFLEGDVFAIAFSPSGRLIAAGHGGPEGFVRVWEVLTSKEVVAFRGHSGAVNALAFSPDGLRLASGGADTSILIWDLTLPPLVDAKRLAVAEAWDLLDSLDAKNAYQAMGTLMRDGQQSVKTIETGMKDAIGNQARIRKLIKQLDEDDFRTRKAARAALEKEGLRALPSLREALKGKPSIDGERQIKLILESFESRNIFAPESGMFGELLRTVRSIQILEHIGGADAIKVLETLASAPTNERIGIEANAALQRLKP